MTQALGIISRLFALAGVIALLGVYWSDVHADEPPNVTMTVVDSEEVDEESFVSRIQLPDNASLRALERAARGLNTAHQNRVRERGREFGQQRAAEAREKGREAREAAGNAPGRGLRGRPDNVPGRPDSPPGRPDDLPGRPDSPPGRPDDVPGPPDSPPGRGD